MPLLGAEGQQVVRVTMLYRVYAGELKALLMTPDGLRCVGGGVVFPASCFRRSLQLQYCIVIQQLLVTGWLAWLGWLAG